MDFNCQSFLLMRAFSKQDLGERLIRDDDSLSDIQEKVSILVALGAQTEIKVCVVTNDV